MSRWAGWLPMDPLEAARLRAASRADVDPEQRVRALLQPWDCMTYLDAEEDGMTSIHVAPGAVLGLEIVDAATLRDEHPDQYWALIHSMKWLAAAVRASAKACFALKVLVWRETF